MEVDVQSPDDVDMAASMKRELLAEFDQHSLSAKKKRTSGEFIIILYCPCSLYVNMSILLVPPPPLP